MASIFTLTPNPALDSYAEIEHLEPNRKLRTSEPLIDPGGGGINVSRLVGRLGGDTTALIAAGGATGSRLIQLFLSEGLSAIHVKIAGETRTSFVVRAQDTNMLYRFVTPGPTLAPLEGDAFLSGIERHVHSGDIVVASGSLPPGLPGSFWAQAAKRAKAQGARFVLDSSVGAAEALRVGITLLRLNHLELEALAGGQVDWPSGAIAWAERTLREYDCEAVVVTHGAEASLYVTRGKVFEARPPTVVVRSAVGAGDSFVAGLTLSLLRGEGPEEALRLGVAAAAATVETPGTSLCRARDVERIRLLME